MPSMFCGPTPRARQFSMPPHRGEASALHFKTKHSASAQVARLVVTLPGAGTPTVN
jgi:hypothetical protein